jgi:hypothetical protein
MTDCPRASRLFGGCKFEPRYDVEKPNQELIDAFALSDGLWRSMPIDVFDKTRTKTTYVGDVCVRCGRIVTPRGESAEA